MVSPKTADTPTPQEPALSRITPEEAERLAGLIGTAEAVLFCAAFIRKTSGTVPRDAALVWKVEGSDREVCIPIPLVDAAEDHDGDDDFFATQIVKALASQPFAVTRKQLALLCHRKGSNSHKGRWGQVVSRLADTQRILKRDDLYADDVSKFQAGD